SSRAGCAGLHGEIHWTSQRHSPAEGEDGADAEDRSAVCKVVHGIFAFAGGANRGRPDRSILQFQRKTTGAGSVVVWGYNQGVEVGLSSEGEPINSGGDGGY